MSRKEIEIIVNVPDTNDSRGIRDRVILEILYGTGLRRSEVIGLEIQDVDLAEGTMCVRDGKGRKDRYVPMNPTLSHWMERYLYESRMEYLSKGGNYKRHSQFINKTSHIKAFKPNALFFNYRGEPLGHQTIVYVVNYCFKEAKKRIPSLNNKTITPHCFRHTIATHLLKRGVDIRRIQKLLGHASLDSTEVYTRVDIEDLKNIAKNQHPREVETL